MNYNWKIVPKRTIYDSKLFSVKEQEITFPSGKKKIYDYVERIPTVVVFPLSSSGDLYLISEFRTLHNSYMTESIAGHMNDGESAIEAAKRELKEEGGLVGKIWKELLLIEGSSSLIKATAHLFLVRDLTEGKPNPEDDEEIKLIKMPLDEAVKKVVEGEIKISTSVIGILFLDKLKREGKL